MRFLKNHSYSDYFKHYINLVPEVELNVALKFSYNIFLKQAESIDDKKGNYKYAEGKWTIKEMLVHIIDTERIFCDRALRYARNDKTNLPGFDHDNYVKYSEADERTMKDIIEEYKIVRQSTLILFSGFSKSMLERSGTANGNSMTVLSLGYFISGHELHHLNILNEKYLIN